MNLLLVLLVLIIPTMCLAETRQLTLDQALAVAMDNNRDITKAREYAHYVQGKYIEERAAALPQLSLNVAGFTAKDGSSQIAGYPAQRQFGRSVDVTLSQPLYTWGKLSAAISAAEVGLKTADEQLRLYRHAAYRDVSTAYFNVQLARELHRLAQENRDQKQRHLEEAKRKFSAGVATDYDVLAAEVAVENSRPEVIRAENAVRMTREQLRFLLAVGSDEVDTVGTLGMSAESQTLPASWDEAIRIAVTRRPELGDVRLRIGMYDQLVTIAAAENKPRLDLKATAGWHWLSLNDPAPAMDADGAAWSAGVYLSFPFFDGYRTDGKVAQARSELQTKKIEEARLLDDITLEVRQADFSHHEATEIFKALSGTVTQAERLVEMAEKGYELGVKIRLEVDDAQLNLLQARSNLVRAVRDLRVAQVNYRWAMGVAGE